jgi:hypothetical protein
VIAARRVVVWIAAATAVGDVKLKKLKEGRCCAIRPVDGDQHDSKKDDVRGGCLVLALAVALIQAVVPIWGSRTRDPVLMAVAVPTAVAQFFFVAISFTALAACYITSDFSVVSAG